MSQKIFVEKNKIIVLFSPECLKCFFKVKFPQLYYDNVYLYNAMINLSL